MASSSVVSGPIESAATVWRTVIAAEAVAVSRVAVKVAARPLVRPTAHPPGWVSVTVESGSSDRLNAGLVPVRGMPRASRAMWRRHRVSPALVIVVSPGASSRDAATTQTVSEASTSELTSVPASSRAVRTALPRAWPRTKPARPIVAIEESVVLHVSGRSSRATPSTSTVGDS